ncbi:MAG TPA: lysophospholipid acyltransferase family protein [bacterium]|jgi:1-acyl-sn-glycerol-3-phosphate acyltransferase|nr:lysophospholipid acyltransferase family protein [bacterium]
MQASLMYRGSRLFYRSVLLPLMRFKVGGLEHIPPAGGLILACNHQSFLDPIVLGCGSYRVPTHFMARASLFESRILNFYFRNTHTFGVKRGGADRQAWKHFEDLVRSGEQVTFFPEGTRSDDGRLQPGNPGSGMLIHRCPGAAVVPARIRGTWRVLNKTRGFSGLHPISVGFGPPVDLSAEWAQKGSREVYGAITDKIMAAIAAIPPVDGRDDDFVPGRPAQEKNTTVA